METKDACFCEKSFVDRSLLVLEILWGRWWKECGVEAQAKKAHGE